MGGFSLGGFFTVAGALAEFFVLPDDDTQEDAIVGRALLFEDLVYGCLGSDLLENFLKLALGVSLGVGRVEVFELGGEELKDDNRGRFESAIEIDRSGDGFESVSQVGVTFPTSAPVFAITHEESAAEVNLTCGRGQCGFGNQRSAKLGETTLLEIGKSLIEVGADGEFEDGVSEVFESLVVGRRGTDLGRKAGM